MTNDDIKVGVHLIAIGNLWDGDEFGNHYQITELISMSNSVKVINLTTGKNSIEHTEKRDTFKQKFRIATYEDETRIVVGDISYFKESIKRCVSEQVELKHHLQVAEVRLGRLVKKYDVNPVFYQGE